MHRSPFTEAQTPKKKKTRKAMKRCRKVKHQANKKQFKMTKLEEPFSLSKAAMPTINNADNKHCCHHHGNPTGSCHHHHGKPANSLHHSHGSPAGFLQLPSTLNIPTVTKPHRFQTDIKTWPRPYNPVPFTAPVHSDCSSDGDWGQHQTGGEGENQ